MKYRDILHDVPTCATHPHTVAVPLPPAQWNRFAKFVANSPADFRLLSKLHPEPGGWFVFVGCATKAVRDRLNEAWG